MQSWSDNKGLALSPPPPYMIDIRSKMQGFLLYQAINNVVILTQNMRHINAPMYSAILDRWRVGNYTQEDLDYVNATYYAPAPSTTNDGGNTRTNKYNQQPCVLPFTHNFKRNQTCIQHGMHSPIRVVN